MLIDKRGFPAPVSVHPGQVQDRYVDEMRPDRGRRAAAAGRGRGRRPDPRALRRRSCWTCAVRRMAVGRVALIGDAAFAARPHAAAGTAKAAADAWSLADALEAERRRPAALAASGSPDSWLLGDDLLRRVSEMGARSQFTNTWDPSDPACTSASTGPTCKPIPRRPRCARAPHQGERERRRLPRGCWRRGRFLHSCVGHRTRRQRRPGLPCGETGPVSVAVRADRGFAGLDQLQPLVLPQPSQT